MILSGKTGSVRAAVLVGCLSAVNVLANSVTWNITTIATQGSSVIGGYALNQNGGNASIAPNDNYVAFVNGYSSSPGGGGAGNGIFASDGSVVAHTGETIGGVTISSTFLYGPDISSSDTVLFATYPAAGGQLKYFSGDALLGAQTYQGSSLAYAVPFGFTSSGFFGAMYNPNVGTYLLGDASGPLDTVATGVVPGGENNVSVNASGSAVYAGANLFTGIASVFDQNGNVLASPGSVIAGVTLTGIGISNGYSPVSINDDGTIAFLATYNHGNSCGIFSQTALLKALTDCRVEAININNSGEVAWFNPYTTSLFTLDGLVTDEAGHVGNRFLNNLGSLTWAGNGVVDLATEVSAAPEPATWWLMTGAAAVILLRRRWYTAR